MIILFAPLAIVLGLLLVRLVFTPAGLVVIGLIAMIPIIFVVSTILTATGHR
jgi:hypothetical protein